MPRAEPDHRATPRSVASSSSASGAVISAHVVGTASPSTLKVANRDWPMRVASRRVIWRCGSARAKAAIEAWSSHTEKVQNVFRRTSAFRP